jgi:hypothetical protein
MWMEDKKMESKTIKGKADSIIKLIDVRKDKGTPNLFSLGDCIDGTAVIKAALDNVENDLIQSFNTMNEMAGQGLLIRGTDYDTAVDSEGDLVLRLNYKLFYQKFMLYCTRSNSYHTILSLSKFKKLIRVMPYCKSYNSPVWFVEFVEKGYTSKKLFRSAVMDFYKLQAAGAELNNFIEEKN